MSGHNKWSTIKHRKGAQDAKRAKIFSRLSKGLIIAAQSGGSDPEMNASLKIAIDQARRENMPKDNIDRAIKRGSGEGGEDTIEEVIYEAYFPTESDNVALLILCATDNTNRTVGEIKSEIKKNGGKFVPSGSVSFQFEHVGSLIVESDDHDQTELAAIDAGATDIFPVKEALHVITSPKDLRAVQTKLEEDGAKVAESMLTYMPKQSLTLSNSDREKYERFYEVIDDHDDVQMIYDNVAA